MEAWQSVDGRLIRSAHRDRDPHREKRPHVFRYLARLARPSPPLDPAPNPVPVPSEQPEEPGPLEDRHFNQWIAFGDGPVGHENKAPRHEFTRSYSEAC